MTHCITITYGDGAVNEHPRGTICDIAPINPEDDQLVDFGDEADPTRSDGEHEI
jgi:hypothetical protein